ncbi:SpoIIE family protein phosphatase [Cellulomonas fimi]|uniref:SpoIIE family protein phosphatase n=1 Tax=Cellulomonas fimi TaxID=1708 RepID=UPI00235A0575|nr:SpoIIE family protein phosphatase [Cellulomonas fimi]
MIDLTPEEALRLALVDGEVAACISDPTQPDDPLIWVNAAFERLTGHPASEVLGRNCRFLQGPGTDPGSLGELRTALDEGRTAGALLLNYRRDGTPFWNQLVIMPVHDADGAVVRRVAVQTDVTARVQAEHAGLGDDRSAARLDLLARVSDELALHLDYNDAVDALADVAIPPLATWGFVAVTDERGRFEHVHVVAGSAADVALADSLGAQDVSWLQRSPRTLQALSSPPGYVAEPFPVDVGSLPGRTTPAQLALLQRLGLGSAMVVPLRARERVLGVLCLVHEKVDGFTPDTVVTAAHLGRRAGLALENVRLFLAQRSAALTLQHSLLPEIPRVPGLDVAASYLPSSRLAEVGGDWFDVLPLAGGTVGLAVGDVVGHDLRAAAAMGQLRSLLRSYAWEGSAPGAVLDRIDGVVRGLDLADIATCVYARWSPDGDGGVRLDYARAGHPPPMLRLPGGRVLRLDGSLRTPVGLPGLPSVPDATVTVPEGATLVLYTDGLVERRDRALADGLAVLEATLAAVPDGTDAAGVRDALVDALVAVQQEDDVCLLVVRRG